MKRRGAGLALIVALLFLPPQGAKMAINPELLQEPTAEALALQILEVETTRVEEGEDIRVRARVLAVERSAAGLKPGDEIEIRYLRDDASLAEAAAWIDRSEKEGFVGEVPAHPPAAPVEGARIRAFLAPSTDASTFRPGAHRYSFEPLDE